MTGPRAWTILLGIALVGAGVGIGRYMHEGSIARFAHLHSCASSKQFLVEFRLPDEPTFVSLRLGSFPLGRAAIKVDVDGEHLGVTPENGLPVRRYFCEGNHEATIGFHVGGWDGPMEEHRVEFALSRASLFYVLQHPINNDAPVSCMSRACSFDVVMELSRYSPDGERAGLNAGPTDENTSR